jgi:hypothetical protein
MLNKIEYVLNYIFYFYFFAFLYFKISVENPWVYNNYIIPILNSLSVISNPYNTLFLSNGLLSHVFTEKMSMSIWIYAIGLVLYFNGYPDEMMKYQRVILEIRDIIVD